MSKKHHNIKSKFFGLALLAAGVTSTTLPIAMPQVAIAAETSSSSKTDNMYAIVRKINLYYKNDNGSIANTKTLTQTGYVSNKSMKFTFKERKVADLFGGNLGIWKPDKDVIPAVTATYDNPPKDVNVYLTKDTSKVVEESKKVTRTIRYFTVDETGKKSSAGSKSESVTFTRYGTISNGKKVMNAWSGTHTFSSFAVPAKSGYTANMKTVPAVTVKPTDSDITVNVIYTKNTSKTVKSGWTKDSKGWHYCGNDGKYYTGWHYMTSKEGEKTPHWSYFDKNGTLYTGWHKMGAAEGEKTVHWSFFGANGWLRTGWVWMDKSQGEKTPHWSFFGSNGWLRTGLQNFPKTSKEAAHKSFFGDNGWLRTNTTFTTGSVKYKADGRGWLTRI